MQTHFANISRHAVYTILAVFACLSTASSQASITVEPDSINVFLGEGDSTTSTLTIGNQGTANLIFNIKNSSVNSPRLVPISYPFAGETRIVEQSPTGTASVALPSARKKVPAATLPKVALYGDYSDASNVMSMLTNNGFDCSILTYTDIVGGTLTNFDVLVLVHQFSTGLSLKSAIETFAQSGGGIVTEWASSTVLFSSLGSNILAPITPQWGWFAGTVDHGGYVGTNTPIDIVDPGHPLAAGLSDPYSAQGATEYFYTLSGYSSTQLHVVGTYSGHSGTWPALLVGNKFGATVVIHMFDSGDDATIASNTQLWINSVNTAAHSSNWVSEFPLTGSVPPGSTQEIEVRLNAKYLLPNDYEAQIIIESNDSLHPVKNVSTHLHVFGQPKLVVSPETLNFGRVLTGVNAVDTILMSNLGSVDLHVDSINSDNPAFVAHLAFASIPPKDAQKLFVRFMATDTGEYSGTLTLVSNDVTTPSLLIPMKGTGAFPPLITVSPDSFVVSITEGDTADVIMTLGNAGSGRLDFLIKNQILATTPSIIPGDIIMGATPVPTRHQNMHDESIRILAFLGGGTRNILDSLGLQYTNVTANQFDTTKLSNYDVFFVGTMSDYTSLLSLYNRRTDIEDFVRNGGGIAALANGGSSGYEWRWLPASINFVQASGDVVHIVEPGHPVMSSLTDNSLSNWSNSYHNKFVTYDSYLRPLAIAGDGSANAVILAGEFGVGRVVMSGGDPDFHFQIAGDPKCVLVGNMIRWAGEPRSRWISENPDSGSVLPGSTQEVVVSLDARKLGGGNYNARIAIDNNDPHERVKYVPVHLHVEGKPVLSVVPDTLDFGEVFVNTSSLDTARLRNTGSLDLEITGITSSNPVFRANLVFKVVPPKSEKFLLIKFTPNDTGTFSGTLTIASNDDSHPLRVVSLRGVGTFTPSITVTPDSFSISVNEGDSTFRTMTIGNAGLGPLHWSTGGSSSSANSASSVRFSPPVETFANYQNGVELADPAAGLSIGRVVSDPGFHNAADQNILWRSPSADPPGLTTIDFDDTTSPCSFNETYTLRTRYGGQGVTFQSGTNSNGGAILNSCGGFGVTGFSSPNFLAFNSNTNTGSGGLAALPETLYFSKPIDFVSLNAGAGGSSIKIILTGLTRQNIVVAKDSLYTSSVLTSIEVSGLGISKVVISTPTVGSYTLVLDDLRFRSTPWLGVEPKSGTVAPLSVEDATIGVHAKDLTAGDYLGYVTIESNDPLNRLKTVSVNLHVNGVPILGVQPDTLKFGNVFVGYDKRDTLRVRNTGSATLQINGITASDSQFQVNRTNFSVPPHGEAIVVVTLTPDDTAWIAATLTITSNDSATPSKNTSLTGRGVYTPSMTVSPESLRVTLSQGDSINQPISIGNVGAGDLSWNASIIPNMMQPGASDIAGMLPGGNNARRIRQESWDAIESHPEMGAQQAAVATFPIPFYDGFEDQNLDGWTVDPWSGVREVSNATAAEGQYSFHHHNDGGGGHFSGIHTQFDAGSRPKYVSFFVRSASDSLAAGYFVLTGDTMTNDAIFFFLHTNGAFYINNDAGGSNTYPYMANRWYFIEFRNINFATKKFDFYLDGVLVKANILFRHSGSISEFRRLYLYNFHITDTWWDAINVGTESYWAKITPDHGMIAPGTSVNANIKINSNALPFGTHRLNLRIEGNDPINSMRIVPIVLDVVTDIRDHTSGIPAEFKLAQNYPNPFNPTTVIRYQLPVSSYVTLKVYNVLGQEIAVLFDGMQEPGFKTAEWNAGNLPSAVYFYRIQAGTFVDTKKVLLIK